LSSIALPRAHSRLDRGFVIALVVSLAIHVLFFTLAPKPRYEEVGPPGEQTPLRVELVTREVPNPVVETPPAPRVEPRPHTPPPRGERRPPERCSQRSKQTLVDSEPPDPASIRKPLRRLGQFVGND
jgi:hypothetical protein